MSNRLVHRIAEVMLLWKRWHLSPFSVLPLGWSDVLGWASLFEVNMESLGLTIYLIGSGLTNSRLVMVVVKEVE